jgi:FkbH-like protein
VKLKEALEILQKSPSDAGEEINAFLACGFTPLHLGSFLAAGLQLRFPDSRVILSQGLYGDLVGNIERMQSADPVYGSVVLEWTDFDPRLGIRSLGGWAPETLPDILNNVKSQTDRIIAVLERSSKTVPLSVCLPTLPLPPVSYMAGGQASSFDLQLRALMAAFNARLAEIPSVKIVNPQRLDHRSSPNDRLDVKSELESGFPYKLPHASAIAELLVGLIAPPAAKKGLITDLDDTFWKGLLGEVGVEGISWDLDRHSHIHGLYQQLLSSFASAGVLIAVASKNDSDLVQQALGREDLLLPPDRIFPIEAGWGLKSESIGRILKAWNIGADSVVFVDDSAMEQAEVKAAYPDMECLQFPTGRDQAAYELMEQLRDLFGKDTISQEDTIRTDSIRQMNAVQSDVGNTEGQSDEFLAQAEGEITASFVKEPLDPRALDLINKTNQFNLNGKRLVEGIWRKQLDQAESFLMIVAYQDKFGPLGKIAVLSGNHKGNSLYVDTWVMSCRAFSRRVEHKCLDLLFNKFGVEEILFDYLPTLRNTPLQEFLAQFPNEASDQGYRITSKSFDEHCPPLFHNVKEPAIV